MTTILEMIQDENENIRAFGDACLKNAIEEQIEKNKDKTIKEIEAQEVINDILGELSK